METIKKRFSIRRFLTAMMAAVMVLSGLPTGLTPVVYAAGNATLTINVKDEEGNAINDATITVKSYDSYEDVETELTSESYGVYKYYKGDEITYTVSKNGYTTVSDTFTEYSGDKTVDVVLKAASAGSQKLEAIKNKFETYAKSNTLKPNSASDTNIKDYILNIVKGLDGVDTSDVTVDIKSSDAEDWIAADGKITYKKYDLQSYNNYKKVTCVFTFKTGGDTLDSANTEVVVGCDLAYVDGKVKEEMDAMAFSDIGGNNASASEVKTQLELPEYGKVTATSSWSKITWESKNTEIISITNNYTDDYNHKVAKVTQPATDTVVKLVGTFKFKDTTYADKASDFKTFTREFEVTVKGTGSGVTEESLRTILNTYYLNKDANGKYVHIKDYDTEDLIDPAKVESNKLQFDKANLVDEINSKEISISYEGTDNLFNVTNGTISGGAYGMVSVNRTVGGTGKLKVTFTRGGVTVSEEIELSVFPEDESKIDEAIELMEYAKAHFWDAINDKANASKDNVTKSLHAFKEINKDGAGNPRYIYDVKDRTGGGIVPQDLTEGMSIEEMENAAYNFESSNRAVINKDNLNLTQPEYNTEVTIKAKLCSAAYKDMAKANPTNEKLQKLINQEVSVTVTVKGTKGEKPSTPAGPHKDINVLFTIANKGELAKANDGTYMANRTVAARDINKNGKITLDEVLVAAHETYNKKNGYSVAGSIVDKLWGVSTTATGFVRNNAFTKVVTDEIVNENDSITAFIFKDQADYSDRYTFFDSGKKETVTNSEIALTLKGVNDAGKQFVCANTNVKLADGNSLGKTDKNGVIKVSFKKAGTYTVISDGTVSEGGSSHPVVPAACIIKVNATGYNDLPDKPVTPTSIKLSKNSAVLSHGKTLKLVATVKPSNAKVIWETSDSKVASIKANGHEVIVTGLKKGTATITVRSTDGKKKAKCRVTVKPPVEVKSISVKKHANSIKLGKSAELQASVNPTNAENKTLIWRNLTPKIAKITAKGNKAVVKGIKAGKAKVRVTSANGKKKDITITVKGPVEAKSVSISKKSSKVNVGRTLKLTAKIHPSNTENKTVKWESLTPNLARVTGNGLNATVTGLASGKAKIRVTTANGRKKDVTITVKAPKTKKK